MFNKRYTNSLPQSANFFITSMALKMVSGKIWGERNLNSPLLQSFFSTPHSSLLSSSPFAHVTSPSQSHDFGMHSYFGCVKWAFDLQWNSWSVHVRFPAKWSPEYRTYTYSYIFNFKKKKLAMPDIEPRCPQSSSIPQRVVHLWCSRGQI